MCLHDLITHFLLVRNNIPLAAGTALYLSIHLLEGPGGGHGSPLQYSCLEHPMDRGGWRATAHRVAQSGTTEMT